MLVPINEKTVATRSTSVASLPPAGSTAIENSDDDYDTCSSSSHSEMDRLFDKILKEQNINALACLEDDINPLIKEYEVRSGNHLSIKRSLRDSFRLYVCREHINCTFEIFVGKRRGDGMLLVKRVVATNTKERRQPLAVDGRQWKKRRAGKLDNMIAEVRKSKNDNPTPADVIKTAATHSALIVSDMAAYRALNYESSAQLWA